MGGGVGWGEGEEGRGVGFNNRQRFHRAQRRGVGGGEKM